MSNEAVPNHDMDPAVDDDANQMLLAPDHPLLAPVQAKIADQFKRELSGARDSIRELRRVKQLLEKRHEQVGVELYTFQRQLSDAQSRAEGLDAEFAENAARRRKMQDDAASAAAKLRAAEELVDGVRRAEDGVRAEHQRVAQEVLDQGLANEALRSDALVRKRSVYRAEEQIQLLEKEKGKADQFLAECYDELKRLQDEEAYLAAQLSAQAGETGQAQDILREAYSQIGVIQQDVAGLQRQWQLTLAAVEKRSLSVRELADTVLAELESERSAVAAGILGCHQELQRVRDETLRVAERTRARQVARDAALARYNDIVNNRVARLQAKYAALEASLQEANASVAGLVATVERQQRENDALSARSDAATREINAREGALLVRNAEALTSSRQCQALLGRLEKTRGAIVDAEREASRLLNEEAKRQLDIATSEASLDSYQSLRDALAAEVAEKDRLVTSYELQISKNASAIEQRASAITRLNRKLEEFHKNNPGVDNGPLESIIQNLGKEILAAGRQLKEAQALWLRAQSDLVGHVTRHEKEAEGLALLEDQRDVLRRKAQALAREIEERELKLRAIHRESEHLHEDIVRANGELAALVQAEDALQGKNFVREGEALAAVEREGRLVREMEQRLGQLKESKAEYAGILVEVEEQVGLWQRKIALQQALLASVLDNRDKEGEGEVARLEKDAHQMELRLAGLRRMQRELLTALEQGVGLRDSLAMTGRARAVLSAGAGAGAAARPGAAARTGLAGGAGTAMTGMACAREQESVQQKLDAKRAECEGLRGALEDVLRGRAKLEQENDELLGVAERLTDKLQSVRAAQ